MRVEATSSYLGTRGALTVFQYRIRVSNEGSTTVRLLGRHWVIRNGDGGVHQQVPKGSKGVVGQTPVLRPGQAFEYASGTDFATPGGSVQGSFQMLCLDTSTEFDADVGRFECLVDS